MSKDKKTIEVLLEEAIIPEDKHSYEVPENWVWTKFGKVAKLNNGYAFKSTDYQEEGIPVIRISDISGEITSLQKAVKVPSQLYNERFLIKKGDLLIAMSGATTGKTGVYNSDKIALQNQRVGNIKEINQHVLYPKFRNYFVFNNSKEVLKNSYGGAQPNISGSLIEQLSFPLPPLNEQKRIAEKVESLLNKIDKAKQLIEEAEETFEFRKASILDKAFHGNLTKKWRAENSSYLQPFAKGNNLEDIHVENDFYQNFNLPSAWVWAKAESLFSIQPRNGYSPQSTESITNTKTIKLGAITKGYFKENEYKYIDEIIDKDSYLWLNNGDFLIQRANSLDYVGTAAIYTGKDKEYIYPDLIMKGRLNEDLVDSEYMVLWINSHYGKKYVKQNATGTAGNMPKINQNVVKNFFIPLPPLQEQKEIIKLISKTVREDIQVKINDSYDLLEGLKQSILSKAFRGELGTNNPNEESAIELLIEVLHEQVK